MKIKDFLVLSFFILAVLIIFPRHFYIPPDWLTVDDGRNWALAFFTTHRSNYAWGRDVIYTYGPLGIFSTRWFPAAYIPVQLAVDMYVLLCLSITFFWIKKTGTRAELYLLSLSLLVSMWEINMLLQLLNIIYLIMIFRNSKSAWLSIPVVVGSSFLMYVKLNTLIVTIPILITLFMLLLKYRKFRLLGISAGILIGMNLFFIYALNVASMDYLRTAFDTVADHAYAMYMFKPSSESPFHVSIVFSLVFCVSLFYVMILKPTVVKTLLVGSVALFYFVLFKEGFVRADMGHYAQYFRFVPLTFLCIYLLVNDRKKIFAAILILSALFVLTDGYNEGNPLFSGETPVLTYLREVINDDAFISDDPVSPNVGSVDYLNNSCLLGMNNPNKNWHSRPAFQSMIAISPMIDSINAAYYLSSKAPDTLFYDNLSLDDLNPMWDDPQLKQVIVRRYKAIRESRGVFTLIKLPQPTTLNYTLLMDTVISFDETLSIPTGTNDMKAEVAYTWMGRLRGMLWQPPHVTVRLNDRIGYRYISPLHNNQFLLIDPQFKTLSFQTDMNDGVMDRVRIRFYKN